MMRYIDILTGFFQFCRRIDFKIGEENIFLKLEFSLHVNCNCRVYFIDIMINNIIMFFFNEVIYRNREIYFVKKKRVVHLHKFIERLIKFVFV